MESKNSIIDICSRRLHNEQDLVDLVLNNKDIDGVYVSDPQVAELFNKKNKQYFDFPIRLRIPEQMDPEEYHQKCRQTWFIPDKYLSMDVLKYLLNKVNTSTEARRIKYEYARFEEHDLIYVLKTMIFLVDKFRENNIVWGVGRGSSVSSYILYVIGINKINPLRYNLSSDEFFK